MKKYRCIKDFSVQECDGDGFEMENSYKNIEKGATYTLDESGHTIIGGEIHLDNIQDGSWLEIGRERLSEYFEEVRNE